MLKNGLKILLDTSHPSIISLVDHSFERDAIFLCFGYYESVDLQRFMEERKTGMEEEEAKRVFLDVCLGVSYCHNHHV